MRFNAPELTAAPAQQADNPERLRGPNISWWHGDESALYEVSVWRIMIGRLRQYGRLGYAWLTTTPKGRNWIYQEFIQQTRARQGITQPPFSR